MVKDDLKKTMVKVVLIRNYIFSFSL